MPLLIAFGALVLLGYLSLSGRNRRRVVLFAYPTFLIVGSYIAFMIFGIILGMMFAADPMPTIKHFFSTPVADAAFNLRGEGTASNTSMGLIVIAVLLTIPALVIDFILFGFRIAFSFEFPIASMMYFLWLAFVAFVAKNIIAPMRAQYKQEGDYGLHQTFEEHLAELHALNDEKAAREAAQPVKPAKPVEPKGQHVYGPWK